jgi:hypothetical protein
VGDETEHGPGTHAFSANPSFLTIGVDAFYSQFKKSRSRRLRDRAMEELRQGCEILAKHGICLEPSPDGGLFRPDLKLIDLGVTDAQPLPKRGKFPLSKKDLASIARIASGS